VRPVVVAAQGLAVARRRQRHEETSLVHGPKGDTRLFSASSRKGFPALS
jgi:hypothetical protein